MNAHVGGDFVSIAAVPAAADFVAQGVPAQFALVDADPVSAILVTQLALDLQGEGFFRAALVVAGTGFPGAAAKIGR